MTSPYTPLPPPPPPSLRLPPHRRSRIAGWLSLVIHLLVILLIVGITRNASIWKSQPLLGSQPSSGQSGGGGGREVSLMALPADAPPAATTRIPAPVVPPPVRTPTVLPKPLPPPVETTTPADTVAPVVSGAAATPGAPGGSGGGSGGGTGPGTGPGSGPGRGGSGGGPGGDSTGVAGRDPEPRQLILPPFDYPKSMRGLTIAVTFFVLADGRVDHVAFAPEIPDHGYGKKLEDVMRAYRFRPARSPAGLPVPGRTTVSVSF